MNREVEGIVRVQRELHGKIARAYENLKKTGASKITLGLVEARFQTLEANWLKFDTHQDELVSKHWDAISDSDYVQQAVAELTEEAYHQQKGSFLDLIRTLKSKEVSPSTTKPSDPTTAVPRTTLPRIQLPQFSGKYEDWPAFRDIFQSIFCRDSSTTAVEKLHYLKTCLKGEAEILIRNLATTGENYDRAWKILSSFYENKRLLIRAYISNFVSLQKMKGESASELRKIFHGIKSTVSSLEGIGRPIECSEDLFVYLAVELLDSRSRREWENSISDTSEPPSYEKLELFLDRRLHALESMQPMKVDNAAVKPANGTLKATRSHHARKQDSKVENKRGRCTLCKKDHFLMMCDEYRQKTAQERKLHVEAGELCFNCLGRHKISECASKKVCTVCGSRHHTSLHDACREVEIAKSSHVAQRTNEEKTGAVLLATARVRVADRHGKWHLVRALLDQGWESTIISERLAQRLRLPRSFTSVAVYGVGGQKTGVSRGRVALSLSSRSGGAPISTFSLVLPRLTIHAGGLAPDRRTWPHLQGLKLADPAYWAADPIELLLGAEVYAMILSSGLRKRGCREPIAQNTSLGWIISGAVGNTSGEQVTHAHQFRVGDDLSSLVRRFWEQEDTSRSAPILSKTEKECEEHFVRTHSRGADGRYTVRLPIIEPLPNLVGTRRLAVRVLKNMEIKFAKEAPFQVLYKDFMQQYINLQHMSRVPAASDITSRVCYLPHHGVMREASSTTKLRVVFNGSASLPTGHSLNQQLMTGPNLLPALPDILLRWRRHRFVLATDVEKMYRQINVHPLDRDLQRIVWRESPEGEIAEFQLNTVTYGLACAPFLAIRTLRQLACDEETRWPLGAEILRHDVYMDDILTGAATIPEANKIRNQLREICMAGGFPLKKWSANDASLLHDLPKEDRLQQESRGWQPGESHLTLGLRWHPCDDCFSFSTRLIPTDVITKRSVLSLTARLFDPLGWIAPTTVRAKIYIQSTWLLGIDWDSPLPVSEVQRWEDFQRELPLLENIRVPRWLESGDADGGSELHGFADASERAYAAVIYLKTKKSNGSTEVRLVAAKTKVAPLKQVTLPRLELCAATLLVRLATHIRQVLGLADAPLHLWSDSTVALGWIRGHPTSWTTYVANRVSEIQTTLPDAQWHHIPGKDNPADCASRGLSPSELVSHALWWHGPTCIRSEAEPWTTAGEDDYLDALPEQRRRVHVVTTPGNEHEEPEMLDRFSDLNRLLRVTAWCRRWLRLTAGRRIRRSDSNNLTPSQVLQVEELDDSRLCWIRLEQSKYYKDELSNIERGQAIPTRTITKLSPYRDAQGILRVGGRLKHARLSQDEKHPIILPEKSALTRLIIEAFHRRTLHGGTQLTLGSLRQTYWIPRGRSLVKGCIHRCVTCLRWRAATQQPLMGNLPSVRVTPARPFLRTGVDYAGPIWLRTSKGRGHKASKAFIAVFICLSSRAVHLDVVSDYSADAFLAALRRFVARRGLCRDIFSDCGTNFVGADAQLRALFTAQSKEGRRVAERLAENQIRWHFNPPAAPNFGGIWEAAVKSMKHHLCRVIGDSKLTYEEMATLLAQVEACLNSRPLQALSDDPDDLEALTPGHFLVGSALNAVPEASLAEERTSRLSRWQLLQQLRDHFWERWSKEYLHSLTHRPKWVKVDEEIRVGRLCLLRNETTTPNKWPLARVERLHPGDDGHVRVVVVRTATSSYTRPVNKLVLLPASFTPDVDP